MILVYKILRGDNQSLRFVYDKRIHDKGTNFILYKPLAQTTIRKHFFSIRVINNWKSLPYEVVNAVSLDGFKSKLDNAWEDNLQNQAKLLHTIGLVLSTNSSNCMPFSSLSVILRVWKKEILQ